MSFQGIRSDDTKSAAVCQYDEPISVNAKAAIEGFCCIEKVPQRVHPQHAGASEGGVIHCIRTCKRACVRSSSLGARRAAASLENDDGFGARRNPSCGHELPRCGD